MLISAEFVPTNFEIVDFYEEKTCFAWAKNKLVVFPYVKSLATPTLVTYSAPRDIKSLKSLSSRVFALCEPQGVYKILKTLKFSALSSTALAHGPQYYEVLFHSNKWLYSTNKSTKTNRKLFQLQPLPDGTFNLQDLILNSANSELTFRQTINSKSNDDEDISIVANNKRVFKITSDEASIIHRAEQDIIRIVPILKHQIIAGFVLVMSDAAVLIYLNKGKIVFDKVYLASNVEDLCAGISNDSENIIWLVHIDQTRIHYWVKSLRENTFRKIKMEHARYVAIRNYNCELLMCLTNEGELLEFDVDSLGFARIEQEEFVGLKPNMLKDTEEIVDAICARATELQECNETLLEEMEKLKRINMYSHKQRIVCPLDLRVERIAGRVFVKIKFGVALPLHCYVAVRLVIGKRFINCIKLIEDTETVLDLRLNSENIDENTNVEVDLVTLAEESKAWCMIKNYIKNATTPKDARVPNERIKFVNSKLGALRKMHNERATSMTKLSALKKTIRRELNSASI